MPLTWQQIHRAAALEAGRAHQQLDIDERNPIDPFLALQRSGVLVMRQRLDRLAGAYLPAASTGGDRPGVLINVAHPLSRQKFTAAHELWHHRRDQELVLDSNTEWFARGEGVIPDHERMAEAFASWFLMPKRLVESTLRALDIKEEPLSEENVYSLALGLGTSYTATVWRLHGLNIIDSQERDRLLRINPKSIKSALGYVDAIEDAWGDIHVVKSWPEHRLINVQEGDVVILEIPEIPSSGYLWRLSPAQGVAELLGDEYQPLSPDILGGRGGHRFILAVNKAGSQLVRLELSRPWTGVAVDAREIEIKSGARPQSGIVDPWDLIGLAA